LPISDGMADINSRMINPAQYAEMVQSLLHANTSALPRVNCITTHSSLLPPASPQHLPVPPLCMLGRLDFTRLTSELSLVQRTGSGLWSS
jgi:hypothetical protein